MKMQQLYDQIGRTLVGVFTDTIIMDGNFNIVECTKRIIGGN